MRIKVVVNLPALQRNASINPMMCDTMRIEMCFAVG
jgi:hypothetical protein